MSIVKWTPRANDYDDDDDYYYYYYLVRRVNLVTVSEQCPSIVVTQVQVTPSTYNTPGTCMYRDIVADPHILYADPDRRTHFSLSLSLYVSILCS